MRALLVGDPHCWWENYSRQTPEGPSRLLDWRATADEIVALAIRERIDITLIPGDLFPNALPPEQAIIEVADFFRRLPNPVACNGNHDVAGPGKKGPVDVLAEVGHPLWGITRPQVVTVAGLQIAVLPWAKPAALLDGSAGAGDLVQRTSEALVSIVRMLAAQFDPSLPAVLIGHWAIAGCVTSSGLIFTGGEASLPLGELQALPFRGCFMGHIHCRQEFPRPAGAPVVAHIGAMQRTDFGEERDERGVYVFDVETGELAWHELRSPSRFYTWRVNEQDMYLLTRGGDAGYVLRELGREELVAGAICRVVYRATEEQHRQIDGGALIRALEDAGAAQVAGVFPEIVRTERARAQGLTEQTDPAAAMDAWLALQTDLSPDLAAAVRAAYVELSKEVA